MSIFVLSLETVLSLRQAPDQFWITLPNITEKKLAYILENSEPHEILIWLEVLTLALLTIELGIRFLVADSKRKFCTDLLNIADLVSVFPIWVVISLHFTHVKLPKREKGIVVFAYYSMMCLRLFRLFRLIKLVKHYKTLRILMLALKASYKELLLLFVLLGFGVIIYANMVFFAEVEYDNFMNIPQAFWWAIITMTTVG